MAYDTQEKSMADGSPIELYDINLGTDSWHFCSSEDSVTIAMVSYTPLAVVRDSLPTSPDERTNEFGITLPPDHAFVQKYRFLAPGQKATITIRRIHRTDTAVEVRNMYKGTILSVAFTNDGATGKVGSTGGASSLTVQMPRYVYSGMCNHVLGDRWCTIDLEGGSAVGGLPYKHTGTVTAVTNTSIVVGGIVGAGYPDGFFTAGRILTAAGDTRLITVQTGDHVHTYIPLYEGLALITTTVTIYAGCPHTLDVCESKFNNRINFGGFAFITVNNPFVNGVT